MYIRSGELVIILGVKKYLKRSRLGSLRFQIGSLIILAGIIPVLIIEGVLLSTYEKRAVNVRTAEIQSQCTILCNQLGDSSDLKGKNSEIIKTELDQLTNIYNGRVMLIDDNFQIMEAILLKNFRIFRRFFKRRFYLWESGASIKRYQ